MAGTLTITGLSAGEPAGQRTIGPLTIQGSVVIGETLSVPLASGDNTFTVPSQAVTCLIIGPANGTATLKVRTSANSGDVGLPIHAAGHPTVLSFDTTPASLIINASASVTTLTTILFI